MSENSTLPAIPPRKTRGRARLKHGIVSFLKTGAIPSGRAFRRVQKEVSDLRLALIEQYGGDKIKPDVLAMLEGAIEALSVEKLCALYVKRAGILRRDSLKDGNLALHDVLGKHYIAYANLVRLNLEAAARLAGQKSPEWIQSPLEIAAEIDAEKAAEASGRPGNTAPLALGEETGAGQGVGQGEA